MSKSRYRRSPKSEDDFLCSEKIIITIKEARKLIGKELSGQMSDEDLARVIGLMYKIADGLIDTKNVPKSEMVV